MIHNDDQYSSLVEYKTPYDHLVDTEEPDLNSNAYRESSLHFLRILSLAISYILDNNDKTAATYAIVFALGLTTITDKSMREVCRELNLSHATISAKAKEFRRMAGLPPSTLQMNLDKADICRTTRNNKL